MFDLSALTLSASTLAMSNISEPLTLICLALVSVVNVVIFFLKKPK